jgi:hypothetical protein
LFPNYILGAEHSVLLICIFICIWTKLSPKWAHNNKTHDCTNLMFFYIIGITGWCSENSRACWRCIKQSTFYYRYCRSCKGLWSCFWSHTRRYYAQTRSISKTWQSNANF